MKALKKVLGENFSIERIDAAYVNVTDKMLTKFSKEKIEQGLNGSSKKKKK